MKFKSLAIIIFLFQGLVANAQSFQWQANLEQVKSTGFYNILLTPEIISKTESANLADIRLFEKKNEIPYLFRKKTDSLNIDTTSVEAFNAYDYTIIPSPSIKIKEIAANKQSVVEICFNDEYQVDKLVLDVQGLTFFRRNAYLAEPNLFKNERNMEPYIKMFDLVISSGKPVIIDLYEENKYKKLFLIIENEDNVPLDIKKVEAYQEKMYLTAYLEKNKTYTFKTGQPNMFPPRYDLNYFNDSISNIVPFIKIAKFKRNIPKTRFTKILFTSKGWIWDVLIILIAFMGYLSFKMIRDMQRKK